MALDEIITTISDCIPNGCYSKLGTVIEDIDNIRTDNELQFDVRYVFGEVEIDSESDKFISEFEPTSEVDEHTLIQVLSLVGARVCRVYSIHYYVNAFREFLVEVKLVLI